jgi:anti-sigma regulatory factor (Ser/Thr protein kinase)
MSMATVTIRLSAPAQWHALARAASGTWPPPVLLELLASPTQDDAVARDASTFDASGTELSAVVVALASETPDSRATGALPRPGVAFAFIVGPGPMTAASFTVWAQRSLLGIANPATDATLSWTLGYEVIEIDLPGDARASHLARAAMRSICGDLACIDDVLLATSELTANALQHGAGDPRLTAIRRERVVNVALSDCRPDMLPVVQRLRSAAASGRGMAIINEIAHHWGITVYHDHKVVWCELGDEVAAPKNPPHA